MSDPKQLDAIERALLDYSERLLGLQTDLKALGVGQGQGQGSSSVGNGGLDDTVEAAQLALQEAQKAR